MKVYHGTAARFPIRKLREGPDTAALLGRPMPGLWLTENPELAEQYASWSADCTKGKRLRIISLEMAEDCPRYHNPGRSADFVVEHPKAQYRNGNLTVLEEYPVQRSKVHNAGRWAWELIVPELDIRTIVLNAKDMAWLFDSMRIGVSGP